MVCTGIWWSGDIGIVYCLSLIHDSCILVCEFFWKCYFLYHPNIKIFCSRVKYFVRVLSDSLRTSTLSFSFKGSSSFPMLSSTDSFTESAAAFIVCAGSCRRSTLPVIRSWHFEAASALGRNQGNNDNIWTNMTDRYILRFVWSIDLCNGMMITHIHLSLLCC